MLGGKVRDFPVPNHGAKGSMALLADDGLPIFGDLAPSQPAPNATPEGAAPVPDQPTPNPAIPAAAAAPVADVVPTGTIAEPPAAMPDEIATESLPEPEPVAPNWDDPTNPWRQEAERARQEAQAAQQQAAQMQAHALAEAENQSRQRQAALMQQRVQLDAQVGDFSPEDFQRRSYALNQQLAQELQRSNASKQAIAEHFGRQQEELRWEQSVASTVSQFGLTADEVQYVNQYAKDTDHLAQLAREFKSRRDERKQFSSVTQQLAQLKSEQQRLRSEAAQRSRENGADRTGGVGGTPVPQPAPTTPVGIFRQIMNGDPNVPVIPR